MDVRIEERDGLGLATVIARKGKAGALAVRVREQFGLELPDGPRRSAHGDVAFIGTGPSAWLAVHEGGPDALLTAIRGLGELAAISDQSSGYAVLRFAGPDVRAALARLVFIDLHPKAFPEGFAAATQAAHMTVTLWRRKDEANEAVFELAVYRSYLESLLEAASSTSAA